MVLIYELDGDATVSCKATDSLCLQDLQKKEAILEYLRTNNVTLEDTDEILVIVNDNITVLSGPF